MAAEGLLLAIDTATQFLSVALHDGAALRAECTLQAGRRHSALLAPLIQQLLRQTEARPEALRALAVAVGPGSYTGTRIGVALAKGLAASRELPLVPVTTLEILIAGCPPAAVPLIAVLPAGRGRAIWAEYHWDGAAWQPQRPAQIDSWPALLAANARPISICGEISRIGQGAIAAAQEAGAPIQVASAAAGLRRAGHLADIAWGRLRQEGAVAFPAERVAPLYLKPPG